VAAGMLRAAMGSDTGGSIRLPAGYCGVVGLKPTYGLVPCQGSYPMSETLDHVGPLARTVEDCAAMLEVVAGGGRARRRREATPGRYLPRLRQGVQGIRIGVPRHYFSEVSEPSRERVAAIDSALRRLAGLGAIIEDVILPPYDLFNAIARVITAAESFDVREYAQPASGVRATGACTIRARAFVSSADYLQALRRRGELTELVERTVFSRFDAIVTASTLSAAPRFSDISATAPTNWPIQLSPFNVTGHPALSVPTALSSGGLPLAMQIVGRKGEEATILRIGHCHEQLSEISRFRRQGADRETSAEEAREVGSSQT
jgi:aspartyl-tRNA(Asn)/glutamyl-tRNA(Gln) amidotransferase subunit A